MPKPDDGGTKITGSTSRKDSKSGRFVTNKTGKAHPKTTVKEGSTPKNPKKPK